MYLSSNVRNEHGYKDSSGPSLHLSVGIFEWQMSVPTRKASDEIHRVVGKWRTVGTN